MGLKLGSSTVKSLYVGGTAVRMVYLGSTKVWPEGLPAGTTYEFDYTGEVQSVELPAGRYKLECWGAKGGDTSSYSGVGSYGGYSEGVLTLTETTTLYIFVGGQGASSGNGGWNGGGGSSGYSTYTSSGETGRSYPACGGGATDIALVTSSMDYSNMVTNRSSESLLSRIIVAGGGAGASARYTSKTVTTESEELHCDLSIYWVYYHSDGDYTQANLKIAPIPTYGETYVLRGTITDAAFSWVNMSIWIDADTNTSKRIYLDTPFVYDLQLTGYEDTNPVLSANVTGERTQDEMNELVDLKLYKVTTSTSTSTSSNYTTSGGEGGGTTGNGSYKGTQSSASGNGGFGYGANMTTTNYMYCGGAGGGGWYGGGTSYADSSTGAIYYGSGGSGFVNTAANSSYRPSGYTGLELDSGSTTTGQNSGNGYAKITVLGDSDGGSGSGSITWATQSGTWTESSSSSAADGKSFTCTSPGTSGSTVIRCTFSGVTSITFNCVYNGESNYDYLTVGSLDTACTRSSYGTTLKGTSGTAKSITFSCDSGEHYVEFCYSKDSSVDTSPDNATVYVESYS